MTMRVKKQQVVLCLWTAMMNVSNSFSLGVGPSQQDWRHQQMPTRKISSSFSTSSLNVHTVRDADMYEMMMGGERYEMVPLPDSMLQTTLFVGNLNEFVNDDDLSALFAPITEWSSVPACVVRKPNMASLKYGFVTFPTEAHKLEALLRFHNAELQGKILKVEEIRDHPKKGRVRIPEKMVAYVIGSVKTTSRNGEMNTMRKVSNPTTSKSQQTPLPKQQQQKKKGRMPQNKKKAQQYKLTSKQQQELQRALRKGYVTLDGTGFRHGRRSCNLACAHRQWCDDQNEPKPQIVLCKASGGRPLDCLIVDLSPLRERLVSSSASEEELLWWWNGPIVQAAAKAGMALRADYEQDNTQDELHQDQVDLPISQLPAISMGVFEGERSQAKAMARELAALWELPSTSEANTSPSSRSRTKEYNNHRNAKPHKKSGKSKSHHSNNSSSSDKRRQERRQRRRRENDFFF